MSTSKGKLRKFFYTRARAELFDFAPISAQVLNPVDEKNALQHTSRDGISGQNRAAHSGVETARNSGTFRGQSSVNDSCHKRLDVSGGFENRGSTRSTLRRRYSESTKKARWDKWDGGFS